MGSRVCPKLPEVAADHESRIAFGEKKYGQRLKINNGRDAAMDSYQELLDYLSYAMQAYLETGDFFYLNTFSIVASIADEIRLRLNAPQPQRGEEVLVSHECCAKFVPNQEAPETKEGILRRHAARRQNPENVVTFPFSGLEGELEEVDSNLTVTDLEGNRIPIKTDVAYYSETAKPMESEPLDPVGEAVAKELDKFDLKEEIVVQPGAFITGE
jgi:hypothetical protein